jgi:copper(I)-binding protein
MQSALAQRVKRPGIQARPQKQDEAMVITKLAPVMVALLALGACHKAPQNDTPTASANMPGIMVSGGRLVLPAVTGRPGAAYFTLANQSGAQATVTSITISGAGKAEMHTTTPSGMEPLPQLTLPAGATVPFAPGAKHVMVFDIAPSVTAGGHVDVTFTLADGKAITGQLAVEPAGGAPDMAGMDHMKM